MVRYLQRPVHAVQRAGEALVAFQAGVVRQHVPPRPAGAAARGVPFVVFFRLAAHVDHGVDRTAAAQHVGLRHLRRAPVEQRLRLQFVDGEVRAAAEHLEESGRHPEQHAIVARPSLQQQDTRAVVFDQAIGCHAAGAAAAGDDVVVIHDPPRGLVAGRRRGHRPVCVRRRRSRLPDTLFTPRIIQYSGRSSGAACISVRFARHRAPLRPTRKSKSAPAIGLHHVLDERLGIAARRLCDRRRPGRRRACQLLLGTRRDAAGAPRTSSSIRSPVRTSASGPPSGGLRRHMQHDRAVGGAAHPGVGNADHVAHAAASAVSAAAACCRPRPSPDSRSGRQCFSTITQVSSISRSGSSMRAR